MKIEVQRPKGHSPTCPHCGNSNAMLHIQAKYIGVSPHRERVDLLECRDCRYMILAYTTAQSIGAINGVLGKERLKSIHGRNSHD